MSFQKSIFSHGHWPFHKFDRDNDEMRKAIDRVDFGGSRPF